MTGRIHSVQSLGTVDGPGVRFVVFFQGCPLRCGYCHNPDTWDFQGGTLAEPEELLRQILRCRPYFGEAGGVTLSGGEVLMQPEFAEELLRLCKAKELHTAIDTSGCRLDGAAERVLEQISMVDQDVFLFDDTIRDNIRHARPDATDGEIEAACREANCDGFIRSMEKGYDTPTGENGNLLSGGERQRISIARAILKNSPILLLDEATASLDIENELAVKQAIANLLKEKKTVVMIAHTLSIVKNADQILVVADGTIKESGTHEELLAENGKYAAMWNAEQKITA